MVNLRESHQETTSTSEHPELSQAVHGIRLVAPTCLPFSASLSSFIGYIFVSINHDIHSNDYCISWAMSSALRTWP